MKTSQVATVSIWASITVFLLKFIAYFYTKSISLYSDALESTINIATACFAFRVLQIVEMPSDDNHQFGHDKAEYFSSGLEGMLILIAAISIVYFSVQRYFNPLPLVSLSKGLVMTSIATLINFIVARWILKQSVSHDSIALEAHAEHILTDVWTTVWLLLALVLQGFRSEWYWLDPSIALMFACYMLITAWRLIMRSINGLMDIALPIQEINVIEIAINKILPTFSYYADLRTRLSGSRRFVEFKLLVPGNMTVKASHQICDQIEAEIESCFDKIHISIHVEPKDISMVREILFGDQ